MPPKKKKSGKKKKKSGKKSAKSAVSDGQKETLNELSKEFYMIQIRDLENRLARYQRKCDELELANTKFQDQYEQMGSDKKEIVAFLKRSLDQRGDEIADLNDRLLGLQQAKDAEKEMYEQQLQQLRTEFQETKDQLTSENMILAGKLASLEEFRIQKEDLMAKFAAMEEQLKKQEEDHNEVIYNLERKAVVDKDRLKKEMVLRVNQVAAEFRKVSNKQMAETTKRTIRENVSINAQLTKMSDKTMELIQENDELREKEKQNKQQIEMLEANEKELAKKNHSNQKIIRMLTEKCRNQETTLEDYEMREEDFKNVSEELEALREEVNELRNEKDNFESSNAKLRGEVSGIQKSYKTETKHKLKLEKVLADCAESVKAALIVTAPEDQLEYEEAEKRDNLLDNLLILLNSAAAIGVGPPPSEFSREASEIKKGKSLPGSTTPPGSSRGIKRGEMPISQPSGTPPHYKLGDLGLIPRPADHIPTNSDKVKEISASQELGRLKRVLTKSVAIQTVSSPKALFYADQLLSRVPRSAQQAVLQEIHRKPKVDTKRMISQILS